jgi:hypothetical protein
MNWQSCWAGGGEFRKLYRFEDRSLAVTAPFR